MRYQQSRERRQPANPEGRYQDNQFFRASEVFDQRRDLLRADTLDYLRRQMRDKETDQVQRSRLYPLIAMDTVSKQQLLRQEQQREKEALRARQQEYQRVLGRQVEDKCLRIYSNSSPSAALFQSV